nr:MAG TPA: hypothetical protein [Bacteriophage sp.]
MGRRQLGITAYHFDAFPEHQKNTIVWQENNYVDNTNTECVCLCNILIFN